LNKNKNIYIQ